MFQEIDRVITPPVAAGRGRDEVLEDLMLAAAELAEAHRALDRLRVPRADARGAVYPVVNRLAWFVFVHGEQAMRRAWLAEETEAGFAPGIGPRGIGR